MSTLLPVISLKTFSILLNQVLMFQVEVFNIPCYSFVPFTLRCGHYIICFSAETTNVGLGYFLPSKVGSLA